MEEALDLRSYLASAREQTLTEIRAIVPEDGPETGRIYAMMLDYPLRPAKALRPALAIAACRIHGGSLDAVLPTAAALELYHNAFLIHDDVEDGSRLRRGGSTLHAEYGTSVAINVGDGMLGLAMGPLLDNVHHLGFAPAWAILKEVQEMVRETAEGQAVELGWIQEGRFDQTPRNYLRMVYKKSTRYSFVTPITVGVLCAGAPPAAVHQFQHFAALLGIAFQIHDDLLNVEGTEQSYGKEIGGDLEEGKRTLILIEALRQASSETRNEAMKALRKSRSERSATEVDFLRRIVSSGDSVHRARAVALRHCARARVVLDRCLEGRPDSAHARFLRNLVEFVVQREI